MWLVRLLRRLFRRFGNSRVLYHRTIGNHFLLRIEHYPCTVALDGVCLIAIRFIGFQRYFHVRLEAYARLFKATHQRIVFPFHKMDQAVLETIDAFGLNIFELIDEVGDIPFEQ